MPMDIAVFAGGRSPEHDISLRSAQMVLRNLDRGRFRVWPVFLDRQGLLWPQRRPLGAEETWTPGDLATALPAMRPGQALDWLLEHAHVQAVFPVLHGPYGEDGTVQGMLELYDLPFVGSGCAASAVAMDKLRTRQVLRAEGLPQARAYVPEQPIALLDEDAEWERLLATVGVPCFCKVDCSGSSRGVVRVQTRADFAAFAQQARGFRRWFAEVPVPGEEITVAVLGNTGGELQALPPVGIYPRFCDHFDERAKYTKGACDEVAPPPGWDAARCAEAMDLAVRCHRALACDGMSRTDMIVGPDGPVVLEVNTIPGLTEESLLPKAAAAAGIALPALLDRLVDLALQQAAARRSGPSALHAPAASAAARGGAPRRRRETANEATA